MNILLLTEDFHPNIDGGALVRSRFAELVAETPHNLTVITGRTEETPRCDNYYGADVIRPINPTPEDVQGYRFVGFAYRILFSISVFVVGCYLLLQDDFDVIYSKSYSTHWAGKLLSLLFRMPLLTFIGGTPSLGSYRFSRLKLLPEWINIRFFMGEFVFTRTPQTCRRVSRVSGKPTEVLHGGLNKRHVREAVSGCDNESIREEYGIDNTDHLIVFIGRLVPLKDPGRAVEVLADLPLSYSMLMIGSGPKYKSLQQEISARGLNDRINLTGQLPHKEALRIAYSADLLIVTSKIEAYPSVVFEGLALQNDVFTTDVGVVSTLSEEALHVTDNLVDEIMSTSIEQEYGIDEYVLDKYSIDQYTDKSIRKMKYLLKWHC